MSAETPDHTPDVSVLLLCPFCGETPTLAKWCGEWGFAHSNNGCLLTADLYQFDTEAEAITAWNTRPTPTPADQGDLVERVALAIYKADFKPGRAPDLKDELLRDILFTQAHAAIAAMPAVEGVERLRAELQAIIHNWSIEQCIYQNDIDRIKKVLAGESDVMDEVKRLRTQLAERDETIAGMIREIDTGLEYVASRPVGLRISLLVSVIRDIQGVARQALTPQVPHG